ncbi:uncharacterized protein MONBRDRAFT_25794 [Monosiga brevicollis MX1]|uniref:Galactosylceramide sulfotransferase n=1 Tax=Monosiga brevicollis TaxID=81824 RepID=A9V0G3_MONBE|nr:uncharacterized protein MONBRDRAFT_25794 [Monosiga brevicollis MX1]EDQ89007.1 predicted protein [Monosiga brevicollis MX1]|eukprot:XP_001746112.1 hypothetical protein [Monosiga brevicollis MX1]
MRHSRLLLIGLLVGGSILLNLVFIWRSMHSGTVDPRLTAVHLPHPRQAPENPAAVRPDERLPREERQPYRPVPAPAPPPLPAKDAQLDKGENSPHGDDDLIRDAPLEAQPKAGSDLLPLPSTTPTSRPARAQSTPAQTHRSAAAQRAVLPTQRQDTLANLRTDRDRGHALIDQRDALGRCTGPARRVVYVKTHKTGSSTLTNIFHRYAEKHHLRTVLPKGNTFLGWPRSAGIPTSYVELPNTRDGYDMFCSAHTRYHREYISQIVPDAHYVTILREPTSHFKSSWRYWDVPGHIKRVSNLDVTWQKFLDDPDYWFTKGLKGDRDLLHNSVAFDFGFAHNYSQADADDLRAHLATFSLVLITEYMDESLVLLKRKLCWDLDDVVYFALKVSRHRPREPLDPLLRQKILALNWVDAQLYQHFNHSLWQQIAAEKDFEAEVAEFRRRKDLLSVQCADTAPLDEEAHRYALMEQKLTDPERQCHLAQMDSVAFVRYLKHASGAPDPECWNPGNWRKRQVVYIKTHKTGSSTLTNIFHRVAYRNKARPVLPINNLYLGYPDTATLMSSYVKLRPFKGRDVYDMLVSAHAVYNRPKMELLVPQATYVTILRNPVTHFMSSWKYWHIQDHIMRDLHVNVTMSQFLAQPMDYLPRMNLLDRALTHNSMSFDLGISSEPSQDQVFNLMQDLQQRFGLVLITEYFDESLVLMRRMLCWDRRDIVYMSLKVSKTSKRGSYAVDPKLQEQITQLNWADVKLYDAMNRSLWRHIDRAIGFQEELEWLQKEKLKMYDTCKQFIGWGDDKHRKALLETEMGEDEEDCHLLMMDSPGFVKVLKEVWGRKDPECHNQGTSKHTVVHIPTGNWADDLFANCVLRHALLSGLAVAIPAEGHAFATASDATAAAVRASMTRVSEARFVAVAGFPLTTNTKALRGLYDEAYVFPVMGHPVTTFVATWQRLRIPELLRTATGQSVDLNVFLRNAPDLVGRLPAPARAELINPLNAQWAAYGTTPTKRAWAIMGQVNKVLIAEHLDESLVFFRRAVCWPMEDVLYAAIPTAARGLEGPSGQGSSTTLGLTQEQEQALSALLQDDLQLYSALNESLWRGISREISFDAEVKALRELRTRTIEECARFATAPAAVAPGEAATTQILGTDEVAELRRILQNPKTSLHERRCRLLGLSPAQMAQIVGSAGMLRPSF